MDQPVIDLIPQEERIKRGKQKAQKAGLIIAFILFFLSGALSVGLYFYTREVDEKISLAKSSVEAKKAKIQDKAAVEISIRNLDAKYKVLSNILHTRLYYSLLLEELSQRIPQSVNVNTLDSSTADTVSLTGTSSDYISLAKFLNSLSDPNLASPSATPKDKNMFTNIAINSVTLDPLTAEARFNLTINLDTELLKKE
ncbi:hypothetical protein A2716_01475 [candidate division WWE3 bacterium RIFCSPHIGHO2_01_FULL_40_23]|uniref:Fimbrial assembly protein n=1 Tax=candidate division WWE3 bacterium RIFCSPLOWO2_01_FULL_41_18 TaxID=1802625 RepID=A0A1F4VEP0_UNCKA|nr:MAG: hypothetical protein A2716_01475 [candidate division WWE3 bacterium RIFCSPHIGHO2_01_FULL_40_23]OGC55400.1 MAG: hypothetical protein A3A78_00380 [candidate division WWE3 bacterium RIFCSPLOWO2_01_FULL_41_18]